MKERAELGRLVAELALRGRLVGRADPSAWSHAPLGDIAELHLGKTPPTRAPEMWAARSTDEHGDGLPWVTIADLTGAASADGVVRATRRCVSARAAEEIFHGRLVPAGTLLLSFKLTLGQVASTASAGFHNEAIVSIFPHDASLQSYLALVLPALVRRLPPRAAMKGAILNRAQLEAVVVPLPPAHERIRVVERASVLAALGQRLASSRERERELGSRLARRALAHGAAASSLVELLPELADRADKIALLDRSLLRHALDGSFRACRGEREPWRRVRLVDVATWAGGAGFPREEQGHGDRPVAFCKVSDMTLPGNERYLGRTVHTVDEATARRLGARIHPAGTVIFPKTGGAIATNKRRILGRPAAMDNNCLGLTPGSSCTPEFLHLVLRAIDLTAYQSEGPVPALNQARLAGIELPLPPRSEQAAIVLRVDRLLERTAALREALARTERFEARLARARERSLFTSPLAGTLP